jgi:hypothetical protein
MYRSCPNLVPVTNKYLAQKQFEKDLETYKINVRCLYFGRKKKEQFSFNIFVFFFDRLKMHMAY